MKRTFFADIFLGLIILLFAYTAFSKLLGYQVFVEQLRLSPVVPIKRLAPFLGLALPLVEVGICIALLVEKYRVTALYVTLFLLLIFEIYIAAMLVSGLHLPCSCGGVIGKMSWRQHLIFNAVFVAMTSFVIFHYKKSGSVSCTTKGDDKNLSRA